MDDHEIEISEPSLQALDPETPDFEHVARCACGWVSDTNVDRSKVENAAKRHLKDAQKGT